MPSNGHSQALAAAGRRVNGAPPDQHGHPGATVLVIFSVAGDLTWRKLMPALYNLYLDKWLLEQFAVIGVDQNEMGDDELRQRMHDGVDQFSRRGKADADEIRNKKADVLRAIRRGTVPSGASRASACRSAGV